jgi:hypothetical protein
LNLRFGQLYKQQWFGNIRADVLAGITVALALIPEAIAFSIIAGVDPMVGLYASFCMAVVIAFVGGRSGMISAATGAMALLMVTLMKEHGLEYLFAATILTGIIQVIWGFENWAFYDLYPTFGCNWLCECTGYLDFYGSTSSFYRTIMANVCHGRRYISNYLSFSSVHQTSSISFDSYYRDESYCSFLPFGSAYRWRHGRD